MFCNRNLLFIFRVSYSRRKKTLKGMLNGLNNLFQSDVKYTDISIIRKTINYMLKE